MKNQQFLLMGVFSLCLLGTAHADPRFSFGINLGSGASRSCAAPVEYVWVQPPSQYVRMPDGNYIWYTPPPQRVAVAARPQYGYERQPSFPVGLLFSFGGNHGERHDERHESRGWRH